MFTKTVNPVLGLIFVGIMFVVFVSMAARALYMDKRFNTSRHRSEATVDGHWTTIGSKGHTNYHARYHFLDDKGSTWTDSTDIAQATYMRLHVGDVVPVKYLDDDPGKSRIDWPVEEQWHWHQDEILAWVGFVIGGIGGLIFLLRSRKARRR